MRLAEQFDVDRSINGATDLIQRHIVATMACWQHLAGTGARCLMRFAFIIFPPRRGCGDLAERMICSPRRMYYAPSSSCSVSKASFYHLERISGNAQRWPVGTDHQLLEESGEGGVRME